MQRSRRRLSTLLISLLACAIVLSGLSPVESQAAPAGPIAASRATVFGAAGFWDQRATAIRSDAMLTSLRERVLSKADAVVQQPTLPYPAGEPGKMYNISQTVLDRASTLGIAWALTGTTKYADRLWSELSQVASYSDWNPGHALDMGSLSQAMGIGYNLLREYLTPEQGQTLVDAIVDKGLIPAQSDYESGATWTTSTGNFNVVANSGIGVAALAVMDADPDTAEVVLDEAVASLQNGLKGFAGGYHEGPQYWGYAIQNLCVFADALTYLTGDDRGIYASPGVSQTAQLASYAASPTGTPYNYSDSNLTAYATPALLRLGTVFADPVATWVGWRALTTETINQLGLVWYLPTAPRKTAGAAGLPLDKYFTGSEVATMRSSWTSEDASYAGFKAASTSGNWHPQLDAGSFVFSSLGVDWAVELGPDDYSLPGYQDGSPTAQRWNYYRERSEGNNSIVLNPAANATTEVAAVAPMSTVQSGFDSAFAVADLTATQPAPVTSWRRGVMLADGRQNLVVQDQITAQTPIDAWWSMHTRAVIDVAPDGKTATLTQDGKQLIATVSGAPDATFSWSDAVPRWSSPNPAGQNPNAGIRKLIVSLTGVTSTTLRVTLAPLKSAPAPASDVVALDSWQTAGTDSGLSGITTDGKALLGFAANVATYDVPAAANKPVPVVAAQGVNGATVSVTQASGLPGKATIRVTRGPSITTTTLAFSRGPNTVVNATSSTGWGPAQATVDRDVATKWVAGGNQTLQYDFATDVTVSRVRVKWAATSAATGKFGILVKSASGSWSTVSAGSVPTDGQWATYVFPSRTARYFGILIDNQGVATRYTGVHEVEFYDQSGAQASAPTLPTVTIPSPPTDLRVGDSGTLQKSVTASGKAVAADQYTASFASSNPGAVTVDAASGAYSAAAAGATQLGLIATSPTKRWMKWDGRPVTVTNPWTTAWVATEDTYVTNQAGSQATNYGTSAGLFVKFHYLYSNVNRETYLRFGTAKANANDVISATLSFWANTTDQGGTNIDITVRGVDQPWQENVVTYQTKPALGGIIGSAPITATATQVSVNVTDYVRSRLTSGGAMDFALTEDATPESVGLLALVYSRDTSKKPTLTIVTRYQP